MTTFLDFRPHPLLLGGHLQTISGIYLPEELPPYRATRLPLDVSGGDKIVLHDDCPDGWPSTGQVVLLVHGLAGCHGSGYMVRIAAKLNRLGIRTYRMDMRGTGAATGLAKLPAHAGRSEDAAAAIEAIAQQCPDAPLTIVGFSMGGNIVLNTLADASTSPIGNLCRGIAVSPPVDLSKCCRELRTGLRQFYDRYLIRFLISRWRQTGGAIHGAPPKSIYQFDEEITAPLSGFSDAEDYYAQASSGPRLKEIRLPTRILAARDDPMVAFSAIVRAERSDNVDLYVTHRGGHLGYISSGKHAPQGRWLDQQIVQWVTSWETV